MNWTYIVATLTVLLLSSAVSAQPNQAEVDNCCFVDRQCNSDEEWTNGYWAFQKGQCSAPANANASIAPSAVQTDVDNCCFVDRQCNTDEEWTSGYWAFQNGQCGAPANTNASVAPANANVSIPPSAAQTDVDNCCFVDRQCNTDEEWTSGYWAFQNGQCSAPVNTNVSAASPTGETAVSLRVVDGDTIDVRLNGRRVRVRYIGIDTPERGEACYSEATNHNRSLVQGKTLTLVRDTSDYGPYGRLLRYIYADGVFVNLALVQAGYAEASYYAPNGRHRNEFELAARSAPRPNCAGGRARQQETQQKIDNCCFVNRQCNTDEEWTNGYWAYQNSQCGAPANSSSSPTTGSVNYLRNCTHARAVGITNIPRGHHLYRSQLDGDNDGIACET